MKKELVTFHDIAAERIDVVGWPQMDVYKQEQSFEGRSEFLNSIGIDPTHRFLVFAANSERLGAHEPGIASFLLEKINQGVYGSDISLLVRTHPNDGRWKQRFGSLAEKPNVVVMSAGMGNINLLANTLRHADVVIATQGSVSLDAAAFDRCIINIAFDGHLKKSHEDSVARWYEMDHYQPVVETGGVSLVRSFDELDDAVNAYLQDPSKDTAGRATLRTVELEPFDGKSSWRQALAMTGSE